MLRPVAGANFGHEKNAKVSLARALHKWPEYGRSIKKVAGAFRKWLGNLEKDTSEKITSAKKG